MEAMSKKGFVIVEVLDGLEEAMGRGLNGVWKWWIVPSFSSFDFQPSATSCWIDLQADNSSSSYPSDRSWTDAVQGNVTT